MSQTLTLQYSNIDTKDYKITEKYLNSLSMTFQNGFEDAYFQIEVVREPAILEKLRQAGIFDLRGGWHIILMADKGITLYIVCPLGDAYAFIPSNQIIAIHTVDQNFIAEIEEYSKQKKKKSN